MQKKWKWLVVLCLAAPLLSFLVFRPEWRARLVAVSAISLTISALVIIYGAHPGAKMLGSHALIANRVTPEAKRRIELCLRALVLAFGLFFVWFVSFPLTYDLLQVTSRGGSYLREVEGRVLKNEFSFGMFYIHQGLLVLNVRGRQHSFSAILLPRLARTGRTYLLLVAPKSGVILDWKEKREQSVNPHWPSVRG